MLICEKVPITFDRQDLLPVGTIVYTLNALYVRGRIEYAPYNAQRMVHDYIIKPAARKVVEVRIGCAFPATEDAPHNPAFRDRYGPSPSAVPGVTYLLSSEGNEYSSFHIAPYSDAGEYLVTHEECAGIRKRAYASVHALKDYAEELRLAILSQYRNVGTVTVDLSLN